MRKRDVLDKLIAHQEELKQFSVKSLAIFGSVARGEEKESSDVDILVEFEEGAHIGLFLFVRLQRRLGEILGCSIDLATREALRKEMKDQILKEAIHAT